MDHFNQKAEEYDSSPHQKTVNLPLQNEALTFLETVELKKDKILDVGCGTGQFLFELVNLFPESKLTGIDSSEKMLEIATARLAGMDNVALVQGDAENLPFSDSSFNLIVSLLSYHHWKHQDIVLSEISRVLVSGGTLLLGDMTWGQGKKMNNHHKEDDFIKKEESKKILDQAGFELIKWADVPSSDRSLFLIEARCIDA